MVARARLVPPSRLAPVPALAAARKAPHLPGTWECLRSRVSSSSSRWRQLLQATVSSLEEFRCKCTRARVEEAAVEEEEAEQAEYAAEEERVVA